MLHDKYSYHLSFFQPSKYIYVYGRCSFFRKLATISQYAFSSVVAGEDHFHGTKAKFEKTKNICSVMPTFTANNIEVKVISGHQVKKVKQKQIVI